MSPGKNHLEDVENAFLRAWPSNRILKPRPHKTWAYRFHLIDKAGGARLPHWRRLSAIELFVVLFNPRTLLFSPVYFFWWGMWRQGVATALVGMLLPAAVLQLLKDLGPQYTGQAVEAAL